MMRSLDTLGSFMDYTGIIEQIGEEVRRARRVMLVPHKNPDADSLGSACAFVSILAARKIPCSIYCVTPISPLYCLLPNMHMVTRDPPPDTDVICVFDAGDARYAGLEDIVKQLPQMPKIINIDHHVSNELFGYINLVHPGMPSTTALCLDIFKGLHIPIDADAATCMLAGLLTDTGTFSNPATTPRAFEAGATLLRSGARMQTVRRIVERTKPIRALQLWGVALSRLTRHHELNVAATVITRADCKLFNATDDDIAGLSNFLNSLSDCRAVLILKEQGDEKIKGSLRTTRNDTDVSKHALLAGGGGHKKAAGFSISGHIVKTKKGWRVE